VLSGGLVHIFTWTGKITYVQIAHSDVGNNLVLQKKNPQFLALSLLCDKLEQSLCHFILAHKLIILA
jgi:hypothetical protein